MIFPGESVEEPAAPDEPLPPAVEPYVEPIAAVEPYIEPLAPIAPAAEPYIEPLAPIAAVEPYIEPLAPIAPIAPVDWVEAAPVTAVESEPLPDLTPQTTDWFQAVPVQEVESEPLPPPTGYGPPLDTSITSEPLPPPVGYEVPVDAEPQTWPTVPVTQIEELVAGDGFPASGTIMPGEPWVPSALWGVGEIPIENEPLPPPVGYGVPEGAEVVWWPTVPVTQIEEPWVSFAPETEGEPDEEIFSPELEPEVAPEVTLFSTPIPGSKKKRPGGKGQRRGASILWGTEGLGGSGPARDGSWIFGG